MSEFAQQPEPNLAKLAGGAEVERRASSSSSGGGSLPVRRVPRPQPSESPPRRPEHLRAASPREVAAATAKRTGTRPDAVQANDSIRDPGKGLLQGDAASATPRATPKIRPNSRSASPQPFTGPSHCSARGARARRSNTPPLTAEAKKKADKLRTNSASPRVYVRASSPAASTKCSTARREIQQARALAAGVKKKPVEESVSQVRGSQLLQQAQAAAKEQAQLQRKEWMAAVKRTQDSTAKFIAQKRMAASSTNSAASEAHQRAQLIRIAQDDNFWLENIRSFEEPEPQSKTPPKARAQPAMPKSIARPSLYSELFGPVSSEQAVKRQHGESGATPVRGLALCRGLRLRCLFLHGRSSAQAVEQKPEARLSKKGVVQSRAADDWASDWLAQELSKSPVVLISESDGASLREAKKSLEEACVRFDLLELDRLGSAGDALLEQLREDHRRMADAEQVGTSFVFVGGQLLPENFTKESTQWLQQVCYNAGAQFMEPAEGTNMTWTIQQGARWLPPKNIGGRRWYQDDAGMAKYEDEHADPARNLYNEMMSAPGGGTALRTRISNPGQKLLRQDAKLDEPDKFGVAQRWPSWGKVDLLLRNVDGVTDYLRSRDVSRVRQILGDENNTYADGISKDMLMWVYGLGRRKLMEELDQRQCHHKVISAIDIQGLREALLEELEKEQDYSPTRQGVTPGVIQSFSSRQLQVEREAESDVVLLLAVVDEQSPRHLRFRDQLEGAAQVLLRAARIVTVDGRKNDEIMTEFGITRFPTLIWLQGRSGIELAREIGPFPTSSIVDRTRLVLNVKELPEPDKAAAALAKARPPSRKFRRRNFDRPLADKNAAVRSINSHSKGFWRHGRR
ncbi:unnamed protein product [Symbiodinium sp. CCMP2456]|nr:unnamed protein product [Symbiodinium sp. CCMP2456]